MRKTFLTLIVLLGLQMTSWSAPLSDIKLTTLVAPVALYPDPLLANVLVACHVPDQIKPALNHETDQPSLNPAVQMITQFPPLAKYLAENPQWMEDMRNAMQAQPSQFIGAIQALRASALKLGNLDADKYIKVITNSQFISIVPAVRHTYDLPSYQPNLIYTHSGIYPTYTSPIVVHHAPYTMDWRRQSVIAKMRVTPDQLAGLVPIPVPVQGYIGTEVTTLSPQVKPAPKPITGTDNTETPALDRPVQNSSTSIWNLTHLDGQLIPPSPAPFITIIPDSARP
jgi:hypothetical protein